ncbi:hypothetical protein HK096_003954 [Nowakowskiella sp. JEL0078]|nr:hypothetical protein HK096_003954 [Nowakowskiella sp. JEL0078]
MSPLFEILSAKYLVIRDPRIAATAISILSGILSFALVKIIQFVVSVAFIIARKRYYHKDYISDVYFMHNFQSAEKLMVGLRYLALKKLTWLKVFLFGFLLLSIELFGAPILLNRFYMPNALSPLNATSCALAAVTSSQVVPNYLDDKVSVSIEKGCPLYVKNCNKVVNKTIKMSFALESLIYPPSDKRPFYVSNTECTFLNGSLYSEFQVHNTSQGLIRNILAIYNTGTNFTQTIFDFQWLQNFVAMPVGLFDIVQNGTRQTNQLSNLTKSDYIANEEYVFPTFFLGLASILPINDTLYNYTVKDQFGFFGSTVPYRLIYCSIHKKIQDPLVGKNKLFDDLVSWAAARDAVSPADTDLEMELLIYQQDWKLAYTEATLILLSSEYSFINKDAVDNYFVYPANDLSMLNHFKHLASVAKLTADESMRGRLNGEKFANITNISFDRQELCNSGNIKKIVFIDGNGFTFFIIPITVTLFCGFLPMLILFILDLFKSFSIVNSFLIEYYSYLPIHTFHNFNNRNYLTVTAVNEQLPKYVLDEMEVKQESAKFKIVEWIF